MNKSDFPVLCGGTFFTLILEAANQGRKERKKWGAGSEFTESDVLESLFQVAMPSYKNSADKGNFKSVVSAYKSCDPKKRGSLPIGEQAVIATFDNCVKNSYSEQLISMNALVEKYIDIEGKGIWLIRALWDLTLMDENIQDSEELYIKQDGLPTKKTSLRGATDVCLPALLLGIWHYIVVNKVKNGSGRATYESWCIPGKSKNTREPFQSNIGDGITHQITLCQIEKKTCEEKVDDGIKRKVELFNQKEEVKLNLNKEEHIDSKSLLDLFEDAIDEFDIVEFVDSDYTAMPIRMDLAIDVDVFIETVRYHLKSFRRQQDDVFKNIMSFVNAIEQYSGFLSMRMFCDDGRFSKWSWDNTSEDAEATLKYRCDINLLYGLISGGGTLSVFGYSSLEEKSDEKITETDKINSTPKLRVVDADPKRMIVNNYGTVQNQEYISIETMSGDINL